MITVCHPPVVKQPKAFLTIPFLIFRWRPLLNRVLMYFSLFTNGYIFQVVAYLKENLTEKNVLLVLQHICLYCSGSSENNFDNAASSDNTYWTVPVTAQPPGQQQQQQQQQQLLQLRNRNSETDKQVFQPSAPPADQVLKLVFWL